MLWAADERPAIVERLAEWAQAGTSVATAQVCSETAWPALLMGFVIGAGLVATVWFLRRLI